jgi:hypothetical protein
VQAASQLAELIYHEGARAPFPSRRTMVIAACGAGRTVRVPLTAMTNGDRVISSSNQQRRSREPGQQPTVQQRSTATVPLLDRFRAVQMRIDEHGPDLVAGDAAPFLASEGCTVADRGWLLVAVSVRGFGWSGVR